MVKFSAKETDLKFKGVRKRKWGKWVSEIRLPNSRNRIWLGSYDSPEKAARAFDAAIFCLRGRSAKFNFPDSPPEIAGGRSLSPPEIQAAAAQFANSESPEKKSENCSAAETPAESPCGSVEESELAMDTPFLDLLLDSGPGNNPNEYGLFPGFDDIQDDFFASLTDFGEENFDGVLAQDSFLWNF